jgi:hypothetical protein
VAELGPLGSALNAPAQQVLASEFLHLCAEAGVLHAPLGSLAELRLGFERTVMGDERICSVAENRAFLGSRAPMTLLDDLEERDARVKKIEDLLARAKQPEPGIRLSADEIREHLLSKLGNLQAVLTSEPLLGRKILREHIRKITLTPGEINKKRTLHVSVEFELSGLGNSGVLLSDGVDAFSQQYGFTTITVTGLVLDACRVYQKRTLLLPKKSVRKACAVSQLKYE